MVYKVTFKTENEIMYFFTLKEISECLGVPISKINRSDDPMSKNPKDDEFAKKYEIIKVNMTAKDLRTLEECLELFEKISDFIYYGEMDMMEGRLNYLLDEETRHKYRLDYTLFERGPPGFRCHDRYNETEYFNLKSNIARRIRKLEEEYNGQDYNETRLTEWGISVDIPDIESTSEVYKLAKEFLSKEGLDKIKENCTKDDLARILLTMRLYARHIDFVYNTKYPVFGELIRRLALEACEDIERMVKEKYESKVFNDLMKKYKKDIRRINIDEWYEKRKVK